MHFFAFSKISLSTFSILLSSSCATWEAASAVESITLSEALNRAVHNDPRLDLTTALAEAAEGQIEQADQSPNPVVSAEAENFLGTGPLSGIGGLEITLGVSQVFETNGKRGLRRELARKKRALIDWQREITVAEIEKGVRIAFAKALLAQQMVDLLKEQLYLAENSQRETERLVEAARAPQVDLTRATLEIRRQEFALRQAERDLKTSRLVLATKWGDDPSTVYSLEGEVVLEPELPTFAELAARLAGTATMRQYAARRETRQAALDQEESIAAPDIEVFAGGRYFNEEEGNIGFVAGVEVPWTAFNRNQGNIRTARANLLATDHEEAVARRDLLVRLNKAYRDMINAHAEALSVNDDLLPSAKTALSETEAGYQRGQYSLLALLDSRKTLIEVRETYLDALKRYAVARAEINGLTRPSSL